MRFKTFFLQEQYDMLVENAQGIEKIKRFPHYQDLNHDHDPEMRKHLESDTSDQPLHGKIIDAIASHFDPGTVKNVPTVDWLTRQYKKGNIRFQNAEGIRKAIETFRLPLVQNSIKEEAGAAAQDKARRENPNLGAPELDDVKKKAAGRSVDLNSYKTFQELESTVLKHGAAVYNLHNKTPEAVAYHMATGRIVHHSTPDIEISELKNHVASHVLYGSHESAPFSSAWCTAYDSPFHFENTYEGHRPGNLYQFKIKGDTGRESIFQWAPKKGEFQNGRNTAEDLTEFLNDHPDAKSAPVFAKMADSEEVLGSNPHLLSFAKSPLKEKLVDKWAGIRRDLPLNDPKRKFNPDHYSAEKAFHAAMNGRKEHLDHVFKSFGRYEPEEPEVPEFDEPEPHEPDTDWEGYSSEITDPNHPYHEYLDKMVERMNEGTPDLPEDHEDYRAPDPKAHYNDHTENGRRYDITHYRHPYHQALIDTMEEDGLRHASDLIEPHFDQDAYESDYDEWHREHNEWEQARREHEEEHQNSPDYQDYLEEHDKWSTMHGTLRRRKHLLESQREVYQNDIATKKGAERAWLVKSMHDDWGGLHHALTGWVSPEYQGAEDLTSEGHHLEAIWNAYHGHKEAAAQTRPDLFGPPARQNYAAFPDHQFLPHEAEYHENQMKKIQNHFEAQYPHLAKTHLDDYKGVDELYKANEAATGRRISFD